MADLTQDEFTVLLIAAEGESMVPIGRWKEPLLALTARELMYKNDDFNFVITALGRKAVMERNETDEADLKRIMNGKVIDVEIEEPLLAEEFKNGGS